MEGEQYSEKQLEQLTEQIQVMQSRNLAFVEERREKAVKKAFFLTEPEPKNGSGSCFPRKKQTCTNVLW